MSLNNNVKATETDCIIPNIGMLFALPNVAVRVVFKAVNLFKENQKGSFDILKRVETLCCAERNVLASKVTCLDTLTKINDSFSFDQK